MEHRESRTFRQVPVNIVDLIESAATGQEPGWYFNIPLSAEEQVAPGEMFLDGPYPTRDDALRAATQFISDALTDWKRTQELAVEPFGLELEQGE